jgi:hypothetical protein
MWILHVIISKHVKFWGIFILNLGGIFYYSFILNWNYKVFSIRPNISNNKLSIINIYVFSFIMHVISHRCRGRHGHGCMVVESTTTYAFDAYHHLSWRDQAAYPLDDDDDTDNILGQCA